MNLDEIFGQIDDSNLSQMEAYEIEDFIRRNPDRFPAMSRKVALKQSSATPQVGMGKGDYLKGNAGTPVASAQFDIKIKRLTANINQKLPFAIFGANDAQNGYRRIIQDIPTGITLESVKYGTNSTPSLPNALRLTYNDGVNPTDDVEITCDQYPYPAFLQSTLNDIFRLSKMRYSISDAGELSQFSNALVLVESSMFGKSSRNSISVNAYKSPDQFQNVIIDINGNFGIDSETSFVSSINPKAGLEVTISVFVQKFFKFNANGY